MTIIDYSIHISTFIFSPPVIIYALFSWNMTPWENLQKANNIVWDLVTQYLLTNKPTQVVWKQFFNVCHLSTHVYQWEEVLQRGRKYLFLRAWDSYLKELRKMKRMSKPKTLEKAIIGRRKENYIWTPVHARCVM